MVVSIMIMIMAMMVVVVGPESVQLQILLLSQFLRELGHSNPLLPRMMMVMMMMMTMVMRMASMIAVMVSIRLMDRRLTGSRMETFVAKTQIQTKSDGQHHQDPPLHKPHFRFFCSRTPNFLQVEGKKNKERRKGVKRERGFCEGVCFGRLGLGRTALAGSFDGDEANNA